MSHPIFSKKFNYEMECKRYDGPKDGIGQWLNDQAVEIANRKLGGDWVVFETSLEPHEDGTHTYTVRMKPRFS